MDYELFNDGYTNCYRKIPIIMIDKDTGLMIDDGVTIVEIVLQTLTGGNLVMTPVMTYALQQLYGIVRAV